MSTRERPAAEIGVALAGAGMIANAHALAVGAVPGTRLVAVSSRSPARAAEVAGRYGVSAVTFDQLPAGAQIVVVATPPAQHAEHALAALAAGAIVLLEKPFCTTLVEADELVATEGRIVHAENLLYAPVVQQFIDLVAGLGSLQHVEARAIQPRPSWGGFLTEAWGGGVLFDLGVHPLAVALAAAAPAVPVAVRAELSGAADHPVDEWAEAHVHFDTGLVARVEASWRGPAGSPPVWDAQAASATGVARLDLQPAVGLERNGEPVGLLPEATPRGVPVEIVRYGYAGQLADAVAVATTGSGPRYGAEHGRHVLDVVCGAYRSAARGGEPEPLPFTGPRDRTPLQLWRAG